MSTAAPYGYRADVAFAEGAGRQYGALHDYRTRDELGPVAVLSITPTSGDTPLDVDADISGSYDRNGQPVSYGIDWDDGSPVDNGLLSDAGVDQIAHQFASAGTYNVELSVSDPDGNVDTEIVQVVVTDP